MIPSLMDEAMCIRTDHLFDAALIGPVDYNYATGTHGLLIGEGSAD